MISPSFGKALVFSGQLILWIAFKEAITLITLAFLAVLTVIYALFIIGQLFSPSFFKIVLFRLAELFVSLMDVVCQRY